MEAGSETVRELAKRINIPLTPTSPPGLVEANTVDPWSQSGKYALGWTYFCIVLLVAVSITRAYHLWTDKLRQAMVKDEVQQYLNQWQTEEEYSMGNMQTGRTVDELFPRHGEKSFELSRGQSHWSSIAAVNDTLALFRWIFYRPIPEIRWRKKKLLGFPSLAVIAILIIAILFVTLYCFLPQPLYWQSIQFGSPPLAIRAGMISVAMIPWIVATAMKSNLISLLTGISHNRLAVFHRWMAYVCMFLALVHMIPFYVQPVWEDGGLAVFQNVINRTPYVYGTGLACFVPLCVLVVGSLPFLRHIAYELFVLVHIPVSIAFLGLLFWHCNNSLSSWSYLWATVAIWALSYFTRLFGLNWLKPWRNAWLIGDEAAVTLMAENAVKITIPTQMKWRPGQFVYLRMPGISVFENHPFTISSLCSEDFPSEYGDLYRDCTVVFRPFGGFTRKVLNTAIANGPLKTYRAYLDGPYGGMQRELAAFDTVILFAGGSGITAIVSQLLNLIKRMRDGKAVTKKIEVVWSLKRLEAMDWFKEELRICRESAPPDTVTMQFYVTAAKRGPKPGMSDRAQRPLSMMLHNKLDGFVAGIASKRNSAFIHEEAQGDPEREAELRAEQEDAITSLPHSRHLQPKVLPPQPPQQYFPPPPNAPKSGNMARHSPYHSEDNDTIQPSDPDYDYHESQNYPPHPFPPNAQHEFHFPAPAPRPNAPHFQYAPNSTYNPQTWPPSKDGYGNQDGQYGQDNPYYSDPSYFNHAQAQAQHAPQNTLPSLETNIAPQHNQPPNSNFDFGFPSTPTEFQKNLMRFAFVGPKTKKEGWSTEYGRPDLGYMLKEMATGGVDGKGIFGRRTCVFVCGPPSMRVDVANTVARLQADIWGDDSKDEIFLHTENYAI